MIPSEVVLQALSEKEAPAHLTWSLRAALNVAALQCQFSPFLQTVRNYNDLLKHHAAELDSTRRIMTDYFKRMGGPKQAQKDFDIYTTRTYNSFSTLDAQLPFCQKMAMVAREALATPKGKLASLAAARLAEIRSTLTPQDDQLRLVNLGWVMLPTISDPCLDKRGRVKRRC